MEPKGLSIGLPASKVDRNRGSNNEPNPTQSYLEKLKNTSIFQIDPSMITGGAARS